MVHEWLLDLGEARQGLNDIEKYKFNLCYKNPTKSIQRNGTITLDDSTNFGFSNQITHILLELTSNWLWWFGKISPGVWWTSYSRFGLMEFIDLRICIEVFLTDAKRWFLPKYHHFYLHLEGMWNRSRETKPSWDYPYEMLKQACRARQCFGGYVCKMW